MLAPIVVNLDVMLAKRNRRLGDLADAIGLKPNKPALVGEVRPLLVVQFAWHLLKGLDRSYPC
jgi:hypothetical protein